jgi:hypothetical protein
VLFDFVGLEDASYNFLMSALKCFHCSTCLFEFGCFSAIHKCPHCRKQFDYDAAGKQKNYKICVHNIDRKRNSMYNMFYCFNILYGFLFV